MAHNPELREAAAYVSTLVHDHAAMERDVRDKSFLGAFASSSLLTFLLFLSAVFVAVPSYAAPIVSVDVDPSTPGIQTTIDVL
jgi:hypothetical protein